MERLKIVGTAHVSRRSVEEVIETIEREKPDAVAVELCPRRFKALVEGVGEDVSLRDVLRGNKAFLLLFQALLSYIQRKIGEEYGVKPGSEMLAAIEKAREIGADVLLIDRDIGVTFARFWGSLSFFEKLKFVFHLFKDFVSGRGVDVEELLEGDALDTMISEFRKISPKAAQILIDERDAYMAYCLSQALKKYNKIVAVVGAGHKRGIEEKLAGAEEINVRELLKVEEGRSWLKILGFAFSAFIIGVFVLIAFSLDTEAALEAFAYWFLINGALASAGAAVARAHPLSIAAAFLTAWLTSINPVVAAGWISGMVEAWKRNPTTKDISAMLEAKSLSEMMKNRFFRVLLVAALTNVGSFIGTIYASYYIITRFGIDIADIVREVLIGWL
ncbi:MAG: TraB/GumN family protein [Archaeoglobaceae archaeon]